MFELDENYLWRSQRGKHHKESRTPLNMHGDKRISYDEKNSKKLLLNFFQLQCKFLLEAPGNF